MGLHSQTIVNSTLFSAALSAVNYYVDVSNQYVMLVLYCTQSL